MVLTMRKMTKKEMFVVIAETIKAMEEHDKTTLNEAN